MIAKVLKRIKAKELNFCPWETLLPELLNIFVKKLDNFQCL